jgi:hypothetical protein
MRREEEDLKAIMELMLEWCGTYGHDYVSMFVKDGYANGFTDPAENWDKRVEISIFPEDEIPAGGAAGKSKVHEN